MKSFLLFLLLTTALSAAERIEFTWPTPNPAWSEGRPIGDFIQPTGSGEPTSGCYGCVRSGGRQFHEGLDLKPVRRNARGEPLDPIFAALPGVVRHVNSRPGDSNYGRYIVLEHPGVTPAIYTLYAHLAGVAPGIVPGAAVTGGQIIGLMGHSGEDGHIPVARAHMHFEMGVMMTRNFQFWYDWKQFGGRNDHGLWNGMNLMGFDPLDFLTKYRAKQVNTIQEYFAQMTPAVRVRIATGRTPDYIERYPSLLTKPLPPGVPLAGWEVACDWTGLPFAWTPLTAAETAGLAPEHPVVVWADAESQRRHRCKSLIHPHGSGWLAGKDLETVLQQLFALRD